MKDTLYSLHGYVASFMENMLGSLVTAQIFTPWWSAKLPMPMFPNMFLTSVPQQAH